MSVSARPGSRRLHVPHAVYDRLPYRGTRMIELLCVVIAFCFFSFVTAEFWVYFVEDARWRDVWLPLWGTFSLIVMVGLIAKTYVPAPVTNAEESVRCYQTPDGSWYPEPTLAD